MFLNIQIDLITLKTYDQQFTLTTKKPLHIIFNPSCVCICVCLCGVVWSQRVGQVERSRRRRSPQTSAAWTGAELEAVSRRSVVI